MTDHKTEAINRLTESDLADRGGKWNTAQHELKAAQVHATLALVEQQRVANLIALADRPKLAAELKEALGL